jgi:hypothetical protein
MGNRLIDPDTGTVNEPRPLACGIDFKEEVVTSSSRKINGTEEQTELLRQSPTRVLHWPRQRNRSIRDSLFLRTPVADNSSSVLLNRDGEDCVLNYRDPKIRFWMDRFLNGHWAGCEIFAGHLLRRQNASKRKEFVPVLVRNHSVNALDGDVTIKESIQPGAVVCDDCWRYPEANSLSNRELERLVFGEVGRAWMVNPFSFFKDNKPTYKCCPLRSSDLFGGPDR